MMSFRLFTIKDDNAEYMERLIEKKDLIENNKNQFNETVKK